MYFDPKCDLFPYPLDTGSHYLIVKKNRGIVFDDKYPYIDNSFRFKFISFWVRIVLIIMVFLITRIRLGLKVKGKKNLRMHKQELKNGAISISNHVHMWDFLGINIAIKPRHPKIIVWDKNVNGENGSLIRHVGGIPIPVNNLAGTKKFMNTIKDHLENKHGWLHIYPEASMWEYYAKIRPFKQGAFYYAYKCNKPIVPMAFSYREPGFIRKKIFKQIATFTLNVGEPIYPNLELDQKEAIKDLTIRAHAAVCKLAGVEDNLYEPIYNDSQRIDYYTNEYGKNYKGSR